MSGEERLTRFTKYSGCGAKLGPGVLEKALCGLEQPAYPDMIADFSNCEDAGLFGLGDGRALIQTVDFFPPIVDSSLFWDDIHPTALGHALLAEGSRDQEHDEQDQHHVDHRRDVDFRHHGGAPCARRLL